MEDGNDANVNNKTLHGSQFSNLYTERLGKLTSNGHDIPAETSSPTSLSYEPRRAHVDAAQDDKCRQRINPLRIHLGKRPFVENSISYNSASKRKKPYVAKHNDAIPKNNVPRVPKLIPKRSEHGQFHNPKYNMESMLESERDKPVPRLVPKSHLSQYKKGKIEKEPQLKEYAQSLGLQPMVKFKCRKCCSMSFKTLAMLREHQLICRAQPKEVSLSPEATYTESKNTSGPSRVTRKVYLCSACGTYYENWNLFLHMREVHNRHICLFCLGMFSKAEKLSSHLTNKHNVQEFNFNTKEEFSRVHDGTFYLMCCACDEICCEKDDYFNHDCNNVKPKPVPVLVSKSSLKPNKLKSVKQDNGNGFGVRGFVQTLCDKKDLDEPKPEATMPSQDIFSNKNISDSLNCDTSMSSMNSSESINRTANDSMDNIYEKDEDNNESISVRPKNQVLQPVAQNLSNGDEHNEHDEDSDSLDPSRERVSTAKPKLITKSPQLPVEKEKEVGIKLKLSLNNANSPVIINSTVDPTVGKNYAQKPPSRNRRPPKRYEKDKPLDSQVPVKPPSIKMTICDRADSPFVKTTIFENNKETIVKTLINNNIEPTSMKPSDKTDSTIKSTIYDNKFEDENTLNRVPKLTVRVPKEFLDKDSSSDDSSDSDASEKLTVDDRNITVEHENEEMAAETSLPETLPTASNEGLDETSTKDNIEQNIGQPEITEEEMKPNEAEVLTNVTEIQPKCEQQDIDVTGDVNVEETEPVDEIPVTELTLDRPLDKYPLKELLKVFLSSTIFNCIYCNHGRVIAVNCEQLALHMVAQHRFSATVDSITAEELMPETITAKLMSGAVELNDVYINLDSYDSEYKSEKMTFNQLFECFQCYFKTAIHKELCLHNRKMHQKTILLCVMCKNNFYTYSELICHLCPGTYNSEYEIRYRCCFCAVDTIASSFRLMVHLRKIHHTCDVCLEFCQSQARLSNHVWKHKLHHFCYRCGIAYRNKPDINNHLFWKHGTESVSCKKCLQKKWPHVYHFCNPPAVFVCDECTLQFSRAVCLKVHKRFHSEEYPHSCTEEDCTEKFVSKKLLNKHLEEHRKKLFTEDLNEEKPSPPEALTDEQKQPVVDLVDDKPQDEIDSKPETAAEEVSKKSKKKKMKEKDALLLEVDLPALNLSESDSSDESDSGQAPTPKNEKVDPTLMESNENEIKSEVNDENKVEIKQIESVENPLPNKDKIEPNEEKPSDQTVLDIWDNFQKYQAKTEKPREKTPPLVLIKKHVCESDHDYCLVPTDMNGDDAGIGSDKKKNKKMKKRFDGLSSSSSSSSDSDSSCSCGSNCSCSSSSGSSSSSSSDSDSSDESGNEKKKNRQHKKSLSNRRLSNGSNVDVMGMSETPILAPEKIESPIAETDLETDESETDEEFYDKNPQLIANKLYNEKRNQLLLSEGGSVSGNASRCTTPIKEEGIQHALEPNIPPSDLPKEEIKPETSIKDKTSSSKKKSKKKKKSKSSRKHGPIKINIPKDMIRPEPEVKESPQQIPNKITISLQSNTVQVPEPPQPTTTQGLVTPLPTALEKKRSSKRRRVPNKFYGYSSDEESPNPVMSALKPTLPPKLEWRKEDLPSPVTHKNKKETPSIVPQKLFNFNDSLRFSAPPAPDPEPPRILMNSESLESSDSDSSDEGALQIHQPSSVQNSIPVPPPTYLNSGTSSLPYPFQRPAVRQAREGESVYCYCRCPYDEVSEMIACDAEGCPIEWFHFECVGIMVPPKGKWYCPECRKNQSFSGYR
ncbi:uncharacterized protein LOC121731604 [Aricia agestis]|uniref:uncharacterized protein LOC121731604 n=1 Tax=Aricia agestis TaxID=91739 RepID=UPI001C202F7D|nr:uncharacterized protein LOC121731604 [Aricia agestis]